MPDFIDKKDAMIVWHTNPDDYDEITEFYVYRWTDQDRKDYHEYGKRPREKHSKCRNSYGNCCSHWDDLCTEDALTDCLFIILEHSKLSCVKRCLLELGKIKEFSSIRRTIYYKFCQFKDNMSYSEFEDRNYHLIE